MTYPCGICNIPGRVTDSLHEPCPTCRREIADWDPPHASSEEVHSHGLDASPLSAYCDADFYDAINDVRAELAPDEECPSMRDLVRASLAASHGGTDYTTNLARHPFGLPRLTTVDPAPPSPAAAVDLPRPSDRRLSSFATGQTGRGHHLPDLAA